MAPEPGEVTRLLARMRGGDISAEADLLPLIQSDLRRIAGILMKGEAPGVSLQPTILVNDILMKLVYGANIEWQDRAHFFATAARQMRFILIDHARKTKAQKRVTSGTRLPLNAVSLISLGHQTEVIEIDEALTRLAAEHPEQARVVEMRIFAGYTNEEIAQVLGTSDRTVKRYWSFARAWLHRELISRRSREASA